MCFMLTSFTVVCPIWNSLLNLLIRPQVPTNPPKMYNKIIFSAVLPFLANILNDIYLKFKKILSPADLYQENPPAIINRPWWRQQACDRKNWHV